MLWSEKLIQLAGSIDAQAIEYKGEKEVLIDIMNGILEFGIFGTSGSAQLVNEKRLKYIAIGGNKTDPKWPNVELISNYVSIKMTGFQLIVGPKGMSDETIIWLNKILTIALNSPETKDNLENRGNIVVAENLDLSRKLDKEHFTDRRNLFLEFSQKINK